MEDDDAVVAAAEASLARQTDASIAHIRAALDRPGETDCRDCGDPIDDERRKAMPSATRCIGCQNIFERRGKR